MFYLRHLVPDVVNFAMVLEVFFVEVVVLQMVMVEVVACSLWGLQQVTNIGHETSAHRVASCIAIHIIK